MPNYGLYSLDSTKSLTEREYSKWNISRTWPRSSIMYGDNTPVITSSESNKYGTYIIDNSLILNGESVAKGASGSLIVNNSSVHFGDVDLLGYDKCINITIENYNKLLKGELVEGYKRFDEHACYNIVQDPSTAELVAVPELTDVHDPLYNNRLGGMPDNPLTVQTYLSTAAPHISIHGYKFEIEPGEELEVTYMVDTRRGAKCNSFEIGDRFTVIFKDERGNILYKNTTYAGVFKVKLSPFMDGNNYFEGETWFSAECIDNHGVGSIVTFHDLWIHEPTQWTMFEPTMDWLNEYGIIPTVDSPQKALENKLLLNQLIKAVADGEFGNYNGLKLPRLSNGDTVYYLDPHEANNLPRVSFYVYYVYKNGNSTNTTSSQIQSGRKVSITAGNNTILEYQVGANESPLDFIRRDGAHICRVSEQDVTDGFAQSSDVGKIWVPWGQDCLGYFDSEHEKTGAVRTKDADGNPLTYFPYLRTYTLSSVQNSLGLHYVVSRLGSQNVDPVVLPDNFKLDLNGTALRMTRSVDLQAGNLIDVRENFNTHICNGEIIGFFDNTDSTIFTHHRFIRAVSYKYGNDYEVLRLLNTVCSRYCTYKDLHISRSLCYESILDSRDDSYSGSLCNSGYPGAGAGSYKIKFDTVGYINGQLDGEHGDLITDVAPIERGVSMEPRLTGTADISLVCTSEYINCENKTSPTSHQFPNEFFFYTGQSTTKSLYACGKQHEYFVSFYDANKAFLKSIKTEHLRCLKKPQDAVYMRITGYGFSVDGEVPTVQFRQSETDEGHTVYVPFELLFAQYMGFTRCCSYIDCLWSNTRNLALYPAGPRGALYERCRWEQIGNMNRGARWNLSLVAGDIEEGWQLGDGITFKDCTISYTPEFNEDPTLRWLHHQVNNNGCKNFTMINCKGFCGGFGASTDAYIVDCDFYSMTVSRTFFYEHPCMTIRNCVTTSLNINHKSIVPGESWPAEARIIYGPYDLGVYRFNFCDDPVSLDWAIQNLFACVLAPAHGYDGQYNIKYRKSAVFVDPNNNGNFRINTYT